MDWCVRYGSQLHSSQHSDPGLVIQLNPRGDLSELAHERLIGVWVDV